MTTMEGSPQVDLVKRQPGDELAVREDDDLELRPRGTLAIPGRQVQHLVTRARQAAARQSVWLVDQPVVAKSVAVTRQLPKAGGRLAMSAPRGAARSATLLSDWLRDSQSATLLAKHAEAGEGESYAKVAAARQGANLARRRAIVAMTLGFLAMLGCAWWAPHIFAGVLAIAIFAGALSVAPRGNPKELGWSLALAALLGYGTWSLAPILAAQIPQPPAWVWWVLGGLAVVVCGWLGREEDRPLVEMPSAAAPHKPPTITAPMVVESLCSLGNSKMRFPEDVRVIMDPHRSGAGVQLDLELPKGVPASFVVKSREPLAASMRHPLGCVWPSVGQRHPGHLSVYVSDQVMAEAPQKPWPLAESGAIDIFQRHPQVTDMRGDWVDLVIAYAAVVIGAQPRMGKTFFLRQLLIVAGLDVRTKIASFDGKGTGDLSPTRLFADFYSVGDDSDEVEGRVLPFLREVRTDMRRRAKCMRELPYEEAPESKVTSELVDRYPDVFAPRIVGIDETQSYFSYGEKKNPSHKAIREEIVAIVTDLVKRGPALGIWVILATQNVCEETIPRQISLNAVIRAALKLFDDSANNMVLGAGAYGKGVDATQFDFPDKGLMWLRGDGDRPFIGRSVLGLDTVAAERMAARARALRLAAGRLTGDAAGDEIVDAEVVIDIEQDLEQVLRQQSRDRAQYPDLVDWLRELRPEHYARLDETTLSGQLRQVPDRAELAKSGQLSSSRLLRDQVWSNGKNGRGVRLADLRELGTG